MTAPASPRQSPSSALMFLRVGALLAALGSLASPLLALGPLLDLGTLHPLHGAVGTMNLAFAVVAAAGGILWARASGNRGLMGHALVLPLIAVVQIGLGEMRIELPHILLGFAYLLAAVSLFTLSLRRTTVVPGDDGRRQHVRGSPR